MPTWLKAVLIVFSFYAVAAAWSQWSYVDPRPSGQISVPMLRPFTKRSGMAFFANLLREDAELVKEFANDPNINDGSSRVRIYEDGKPLPFPHSDFGEISKIGKGHFSFRERQGLTFSTSDNSDPNTNGRHYWAVVP